MLPLDPPHRVRGATQLNRRSLSFGYRHAKKFIACKITGGQRSKHLGSRHNYARPAFGELEAFHRVIASKLWMEALFWRDSC
jgi:hypothetical protein